MSFMNTNSNVKFFVGNNIYYNYDTIHRHCWKMYDTVQNLDWETRTMQDT